MNGLDSAPHAQTEFVWENVGFYEAHRRALPSPFMLGPCSSVLFSSNRVVPFVSIPLQMSMISKSLQCQQGSPGMLKLCAPDREKA
jgi:hypothetical protein